MQVRKINGDIAKRAAEINEADPVTARLLLDASNEIDRLRGRLNEATDAMIRTAHEQATKAERLRSSVFPELIHTE